MTNKLAQSTSPYLQQHADNPVHWQEWGPEALAESKKTGKPILLSIGYSACHWCHVMAHESFEDDAIAAIMNAHFINIKVDREERPDIDQIYQSAHAMLTQRSGGWPLTMFLTSDTAPFFGGTYFPKTARYGLPGFGDLLKRVSQYHAENQTEIRDQNQELVRALNRETFEPANENGRESTSPQLDQKPIELGIERMCDSFDQQDGGFGSAPKFPHPEMIECCLRQYAVTGDADARHAACFTLQKMCEGGIYDQIGGGFARYSVDGEWAIPHFEKMLYDNGPLLRLLADASLVAENAAQRALFTRCAHETAAWVMREMQSPQGGYYSTLDADAEGHEGKFTVWTREAAQAVLDEEEWRVIEAHYGFDRAANFEHEAWNPVIAVSLDALDARFGFEPDTSARIVARAKQKLFAARETRIRPGRDEKILVSWNALMIEGMMRAALVFDQPQWAESARKALQFLRLAMWDAASQKLFATHKDGKSHLNAYLDDYAFLLKALITRLQTTFDANDLQWATSLADALLTRFEDQKRGGFFFTSHDHEALIQRPKPGFDNATPSGNGVAAFALNRLTHTTGDTRYADAAQRTLSHFWRAISQHPSGHGSFLMALSEWLEPPAVLVLTGPPEATAAWKRTLAAEYRPALLTFTPGPVSDLPQALVKPTVEAVNAYLCRGVSCLAPITALPELQAALKNSIVPPN